MVNLVGERVCFLLDCLVNESDEVRGKEVRVRRHSCHVQAAAASLLRA